VDDGTGLFHFCFNSQCSRKKAEADVITGMKGMDGITAKAEE
jgi:hypothetical protein